MKLTLRLKGPYQRWGEDSQFTIRRTALKPTKRGVIGLIMAAAGVYRENQKHWLSKWEKELAGISINITTLNEGMTVGKDFQMVHGTVRASGKLNLDGVLTTRYYLQDADFRVELDGNADFLEIAKNALKDPYFPLFLGSKACIPSRPILEITELKRDIS